MSTLPRSVSVMDTANQTTEVDLHRLDLRFAAARLIDGYRRVQALRRLGRDTAQVGTCNCELAQALLTVLAQTSRRPFAALEEALLLQELVQGQRLSERAVARRCGRDVSWVSGVWNLSAAYPSASSHAVR